jgi:hypothetical protein
MGLGKTVELLACVLTHRFQQVQAGPMPLLNHVLAGQQAGHEA